jgi:hypothetical protein
VADDIRTRLSEALDENQHEIDGRSGARVVVLKFRGDWRTVERPVAEALVERDRQLLADHEALTDADGHVVHEEAWLILGQEVERAAAFWLGTPEVDR